VSGLLKTGAPGVNICFLGLAIGQPESLASPRTSHPVTERKYVALGWLRRVYFVMDTFAGMLDLDIPQRTLSPWHKGVVLGSWGQVLVRAGEVRLGVCLYPEVTQGRAEPGLDGCGQDRPVFTEPLEDAPSH
jgi:hypothetical protein